jgi:hypothetical protein
MWQLMQLSHFVTRGAHVTARRAEICGRNTGPDWARQRSPGGRTHPAAHLHQVEIDKRHVGGVGVDINNIRKPQFGQWA